MTSKKAKLFPDLDPYMNAQRVVRTRSAEGLKAAGWYLTPQKECDGAGPGLNQLHETTDSTSHLMVVRLQRNTKKPFYFQIQIMQINVGRVCMNA